MATLWNPKTRKYEVHLCIDCGENHETIEEANECKGKDAKKENK